MDKGCNVSFSPCHVGTEWQQFQEDRYNNSREPHFKAPSAIGNQDTRSCNPFPSLPLCPDGSDWIGFDISVLDNSLFDYQLLYSLVFNCAGFSNIGFPNMGFAYIGFSRIGSPHSCTINFKVSIFTRNALSIPFSYRAWEIISPLLQRTVTEEKRKDFQPFLIHFLSP